MAGWLMRRELVYDDGIVKVVVLKIGRVRLGQLSQVRRPVRLRVCLGELDCILLELLEGVVVQVVEAVVREVVVHGRQREASVVRIADGDMWSCEGSRRREAAESPINIVA